MELSTTPLTNVVTNVVKWEESAPPTSGWDKLPQELWAAIAENLVGVDLLHLACVNHRTLATVQAVPHSPWQRKKLAGALQRSESLLYALRPSQGSEMSSLRRTLRSFDRPVILPFNPTQQLATLVGQCIAGTSMLVGAYFTFQGEKLGVVLPDNIQCIKQADILAMLQHAEDKDFDFIAKRSGITRQDYKQLLHGKENRQRFSTYCAVTFFTFREHDFVADMRPDVWPLPPEKPWARLFARRGLFKSFIEQLQLEWVRAHSHQPTRIGRLKWAQRYLSTSENGTCEPRIPRGLETRDRNTARKAAKCDRNSEQAIPEHNSPSQHDFGRSMTRDAPAKGLNGHHVSRQYDQIHGEDRLPAVSIEP